MADIFDTLDNEPADIFDTVSKPTKLSAGETTMELIKGLGRGFSQALKAPGIGMTALGEQIEEGVKQRPAPGRNEPEWITKVGDLIHKTATVASDKLQQAGDNITAYYNRGIESDVLRPSEEFQRAQQEPFLEHPISRSLVAVSESSPTYAAAVASTLLGQPEIGLGLLATTSGTQTYEELRNEGVDPDLSLLGAALVGGLEAATEKIPMDILMKGGAKPFLKRFLQQGTAESFQELMTQFGQNYVTEVAKNRGIHDKEGMDALRVEWDKITAGGPEAWAAGFIMGGGAAAVSGKGGKRGVEVPPIEKLPVPETADEAMKQTYMKGFAARLTSIRNNADNLVAGAGNKRAQLRVIGEELNKVEQHYNKIADTVDAYADVFPELTAIKEMLPEYSNAVNEFKMSPTQENFDKLKTIGDAVAELSTQYGQRAAEQLAEVKEQADESEFQQKYDDLLDRVQEGDQEAIDEINRLNYEAQHPESALPTYEDLLTEAESGNQEAITLIQQGKYRGGEAETEALSDKQKKEQQQKAQKQKLNFAKIKAHSIAKTLNMTEADRRKLNVEMTGKKSMSDMTLDEVNLMVEHFSSLAKEQGVITSTAKDLAQYVQVPKEEVFSWQAKTGLTKLWSNIKNGFARYIYGHARIERMLEALDGYKKGPLYNTIWRPVTTQFNSAQDMAHARVEKLQKFLFELTGDIDTLSQLLSRDSRLVIPRTETTPELRLTPTEIIEMYLQAHQDNGVQHLTEGNLKAYENPEAVLGDILNAMTEEERTIGDWMVEEIADNFSRANQASILAFNRPLAQNKNYFHITVQGTELDSQQDPLNAFLEYQKTGVVPKIGELQERVKGATQSLELDAFTHYIQHVQRMEQFIHMAPTARSIGNIFKDKSFRRAINSKTSEAGMPILDKWLRDAVRGYSTESQSIIGRTMLALRTRGVQFALAGNVPSMLRQFNSLPHGMAVDPVVAAYTAKNMLESAVPSNYNKIQADVMDKSMMMRNRNFDRIQVHINKQSSAKQQLLNKRPWSARALSWQRWADKRTTVMLWKSAYDAAHTQAVQRRFNIPATEDAFVEFADNLIERTQPMGDVIHLPDFFRGGPIEKLLTTFQNQVNNNWQFWSHDIYQMRKHGKINNTQLTYRILMGYTLPAFMFGIIGRGGLPKTWDDALFDQAIYFLSWPVLFGRIIVNSMKGFVGGETGVEMTGAVEAGKTVESLKKGDYGKAAQHGVKSFGATTGYIPAQALRTAEGAYDLATGETKDLRRLIWSKWTLEQNKSKKEKPGRQR